MLARPSAVAQAQLRSTCATSSARRWVLPTRRSWPSLAATLLGASSRSAAVLAPSATGMPQPPNTLRKIASPAAMEARVLAWLGAVLGPRIGSPSTTPISPNPRTKGATLLTRTWCGWRRMPVSGRTRSSSSMWRLIPRTRMPSSGITRRRTRSYRSLVANSTRHRASSSRDRPPWNGVTAERARECVLLQISCFPFRQRIHASCWFAQTLLWLRLTHE
mmetsp:Transcript_80995/g.203872  ORF Transcript_80995/g.203872 Transcript_80995/m.203872 type:complete len:219 (-) Transcript_80995:101-757(-)